MQSIDALIGLFDDPVPTVRRAAVATVDCLPAVMRAAGLARALKTPDVRVRFLALEGLARMRSEEVAPHAHRIARVLQDRPCIERAMKLLQRLGPRGAKELAADLTRRNKSVRAAAVESLDDLGVPGALNLADQLSRLDEDSR